MAKDFTIDSLIGDLKSLHSEVTLGDYVFTELSVEQQRRVYITNSSLVELPARLSIIYNKYIDESVKCENDPVRLSTFITLEQRPYMLMVLRALSLGETYLDRDGKEHSIYKPTAEDMVPSIAPIEVKRGEAVLKLRVPTLEVDNMYNSQLINALAPFKKKNPENLEQGEYTRIQDLYQIYDTMKYVESLTFNGTTYLFNNLSVSDKMRILDALPESVEKKISDYIFEVNKIEKKAFSVVSLDTGNTLELDAPRLFVSRSKNALGEDEE